MNMFTDDVKIQNIICTHVRNDKNVEENYMNGVKSGRWNAMQQNVE